MDFIGRELELKLLENEYQKSYSSFIAVYGRRRIGKTELVNHFIDSIKSSYFSVTGAYNGGMKVQLDNFANKLHLSFGCDKPVLENWNEAFLCLQKEIENYAKTKNAISSKAKFIIFIDELPWLAEMKNNGFKSSLSLFWNDFISKRDDICFIVCGSATSWIIDNILEDKGSLANRVTAIIHLKAFDLAETKLFLESQGHKHLSHKSILDIYIALGGVAHYLKLLNSKESFVQNIERLFFSQNGVLRTEYNHLFGSLFKNHKAHEIIIKYLSSTWSGMTLKSLSQKKGLQAGSVLQKALRELEESGFLVKRTKYNQKSRDTLYSICDSFIFFFTKWVNQTAIVDLMQNRDYFQKVFSSQSYKIWSGFAFENICHEHLFEIKKALNIAGVISHSYYWSEKVEHRGRNGAQIDILLKRDDNVINLIECKYYNKEFSITKKYAAELQNKIDLFFESTSYKGSVNIVIVTVYGIKRNEYYDELIADDITVNSFFIP